MKAKELIRLYQEGKRDFRGENLQGQSFKEQDLSGADFSEADIRGTNFSGAKLSKAKFIKATAGLQWRWAVSLVITAWFMAGVSGLFSGLIGSVVGLSFSSTQILH